MADQALDTAIISRPAPDKPIYTLSVAAEILETHPRTLMLYETVGLVKPFRTQTNRRRYSQRDVHRLAMIQRLTRKHGVNLAGVRYVLQLLSMLREHGIEAPKALRDIVDRVPEPA